MAHVEGIEAGLRFTKGRFHLRSLQHLMGMIGRHPQRLSAIHDILSQSEGKRGNTLFSLLVANGIVVERAQHT